MADLENRPFCLGGSSKQPLPVSCNRSRFHFATFLTVLTFSVRILVAPDKFKGTLSAREVAESVALGLREVWPDAEIDQCPIADGGEGTAEVICQARGGHWVNCDVHDALGRLIQARYALFGESDKAVMEMSEAAGLWRIGANERNPLKASTAGVGEMLLEATKQGVKEIIVGLGGSATNDGGFGLARSLGFRFLDSRGNELTNGPADLLKLQRIVERPSTERAFPTILAATDVRNPLLGKQGATYVFGRQKGTGPDEIQILEKALTQLAEVVTRDLGIDCRDAPGAGAAGGLGFGLMSFCGAKVRPGFEVVSEAINLGERLRNADFVITGEGSLDRQTLDGKGPAGLAKLARSLGKPVFAIVGRADESPEVREIFDRVLELDGPISESRERLQGKARELANFLKQKAGT